MSINTTILYSIHLMEEEEEESYVVNLDEIFDTQSNINKELSQLLNACKLSVDQEVINEILSYSTNYSPCVS